MGIVGRAIGAASRFRIGVGLDLGRGLCLSRLRRGFGGLGIGIGIGIGLYLCLLLWCLWLRVADPPLCCLLLVQHIRSRIHFPGTRLLSRQVK